MKRNVAIEQQKKKKDGETPIFDVFEVFGCFKSASG